MRNIKDAMKDKAGIKIEHVEAEEEPLEGLPKEDGFYMPGEFEEHEGCILIWPERPGSWPHGAVAGQKAFADVIRAIARSERVYLAASKATIAEARGALQNVANVEIFTAETDDAWARDVGPTFLINDSGERRCVNWEFNAWGGEYNGLYASWDKDNAFAKYFAKWFGCEYYDAAPFVLEGGSIHSDGEGTILVTEACLLSPGRNPKLSKEEIEKKLWAYLGAEKVIWIPHGIYGDETDEHVDNICAFIRPGEVVLAWTDNEEDPQHAYSKETLKALEQAVDAKGRKLIVHKLPIPEHPVWIHEEDWLGYVFEEGEDQREIGERLAASYVNFYFSNGSVIMPAFGGENVDSDLKAAFIMRELCPEREIVQVPARDILVGGGNIHCITQQIPAKRKGE
ncbi:MAG: agmatine deiminase [Clostridiales bacterium]|nr:agmatine deiminase [Clostridiales bacterium]